MNNNSVICNYIYLHPDTWKADMEGLDIAVKYSEGLAIFNYGIGCDFSNPIVQEARGIIIDLSTLDVVCFPFRKFGNYGESYADSIDWNSARVQEKVDGSIMKLFYYKDKWNLATNGTIDAYTNVGSFTASGKSFGALFDEGAKDAGLDYSKLDSDYTYIFELVSPECPIVIKYPKTTIYHLGTRHNASGKEYTTDIGIKKPKEYHLNSLEDCIASAKMLNENAELDALTGEGYVVVDKDWHRIKVKSPDYLKAHYCATYVNPTDRKVLELIRNGEAEEIATYFPTFAEKVSQMQHTLDQLTDSMSAQIVSYESVAKTTSRKEFYMQFGKESWGATAASYYYNEHAEDISVEQFVQNTLKKLSIDRVLKLMSEVEDNA